MTPIDQVRPPAPGNWVRRPEEKRKRREDRKPDERSDRAPSNRKDNDDGPGRRVDELA